MNVEAVWVILFEAEYNTVIEFLRPTTRKHKDWLDKNYSKTITAPTKPTLNSTPKKIALRNLNTIH